MLDGISKRAVFVTGCDSGFGAALVRRLDGLGCPVFAGCLTSNGADKLRSDCSSRLLTVTLDVTNSVSIGEAIKYVRENLPSGTGQSLYCVLTLFNHHSLTHSHIV